MERRGCVKVCGDLVLFRSKCVDYFKKDQMRKESKKIADNQ